MRESNKKLKELFYLANKVSSWAEHGMIEEKVFLDGFALFNGKGVRNFKGDSFSMMGDVMNGTHQQSVNVNLDNGFVSCTCREKKFCAHLSALFFYYADKKEMLPYLKDLWKIETTKEGKVTDDHSWFIQFEQQYKRYKEKSLSYYEMPTDDFYDDMSLLAPREEIKRNLYQVSLLVFCMRELLKDQERIFYFYATRRTLERFHEELFGIPKTITESAVNQYGAQFEELRKFVGGVVAHLSEKDKLFFYDVYRSVWFKHLAYEEMVERERKEVDELRRLQMYFLKEKDKAIFPSLSQYLEEAPNFATAWLIYLGEAQQSERLQLWMNELESLLFDEQAEENERWKEKLLETYLNVYSSYLGQLDKERYKELVTRSMPQSLDFYEELLIENGSFNEWVEYQLLYRYDPLESSAMLHQVAKDEPSVLMPLYHQEIYACIQEKNRASYKQAVRLLKKLRALYKKKKDMETWQDYLEKLTDEYSRLRAFQEELRKGKVLV